MRRKSSSNSLKWGMGTMGSPYSMTGSSNRDLKGGMSIGKSAYSLLGSNNHGSGWNMGDMYSPFSMLGGLGGFGNMASMPSTPSSGFDMNPPYFEPRDIGDMDADSDFLDSDKKKGRTEWFRDSFLTSHYTLKVDADKCSLTRNVDGTRGADKYFGSVRNALCNSPNVPKIFDRYMQSFDLNEYVRTFVREGDADLASACVSKISDLFESEGCHILKSSDLKRMGSLISDNFSYDTDRDFLLATKGDSRLAIHLCDSISYEDVPEYSRLLSDGKGVYLICLLTGWDIIFMFYENNEIVIEVVNGVLFSTIPRILDVLPDKIRGIASAHNMLVDASKHVNFTSDLLRGKLYALHSELYPDEVITSDEFNILAAGLTDAFISGTLSEEVGKSSSDKYVTCDGKLLCAEFNRRTSSNNDIIVELEEHGLRVDKWKDLPKLLIEYVKDAPLTEHKRVMCEADMALLLSSYISTDESKFKKADQYRGYYYNGNVGAEVSLRNFKKYAIMLGLVMDDFKFTVEPRRK